MLERDPDRRLTVEGARHALGVVAIPSSIPPANPSANLVGREAEVSHLEHWLSLAKSQVVVGTVLGESGVGKTTVLNAAKHQWAAAGAWVVSSRCFEWQSIAFKAADSIIDGLFERLRPDAPNLSLPPDLALATSTFPVLAGLSLEPPSGRPTDKQLERDRALNALAALVADLAKRNPIVLCIDDAQWGDVESAELIARCAERTASGLLVVLGSRPLSEGQSFRRRLSNVRAKHEALTLVPLTYSESYALARRLAADGQWSDDELRSIALDAGGVPLFVEQVARFNQTLEARPKNLAEVVELQYRALPDPARRLLEVVVIDEQPTPLAAALLATGQAEKDFYALSQLQAHRFVRIEGLSEATVLEPYHDRVRRELLRLIPTETQRALHEALASALDSVGASPGHIAEHWFEAGRSKLAARWAVRAAEDAYLSLAFERAANLYSRALSWDACALDATPDLREQHAWALYHAGFCAQAGDAFVVASQVSHASRRHLLQGHAIEALLVAGEVDRGQAVLGNLLPQLGIRPVWRGFWGVVQLLSLIAWVRLKARRLRFRAKPDALALQRAEVTWAAGKALTNLLPVDGVVHLLRSLLFALESGDEVAIARGLNIAASGYVPFLEAKSRNLMDAATRITEKHPTAYLLGMREVALATASTMLGDWRKAISQIESASTYLEAADIPTHWERAVLAVNRTVSLEQLGDLRSATPFFENAAQTAKQRGDMVGYISNWASVGFCRLAANDLAGLNSIIEEYADVVASWRVGYGIWHTALWHLRVLRALRQQNYVEARRLLDVDWPHIVGAQLHRTRALRLYVFETRAAVCLGARPQTSAARRTWLKEARWLERQTANTNRLDARPNSLLIRAAISQFQGRLTDCLTELTQAAALYAAEGMAERELTVRWRIAQLTNNDGEERQRIERRAAELGILQLATWAPIRTPGFWP